MTISNRTRRTRPFFGTKLGPGEVRSWPKRDLEIWDPSWRKTAKELGLGVKEWRRRS